MTQLLIKWFLKKNTDHRISRKNYGLLSACTGLVCNILLSACKFFLGLLLHSIAITADGVNNLSDAGSCVVTLLGFKMAAKPADKEHPFGHGRVEYISAFVVALLVLLVGVELIRSSILRIINPEPVLFTLPAFLILLGSILIKFWMFLFNRQLSKTIQSPALEATAYDSITDCVVTAVSMLALLFSLFTTLPADGFLGVLVSLFIFVSGIRILRNTLNPLLGEPPDDAFVKSLEARILAYEGVVGIHDLMVHNYGPDHVLASLHVEVPGNVSIMDNHDLIDQIERDISEELQIEIVIHMDPVITDDERINALKKEVIALAQAMDGTLTIHDFRVVEGKRHTNLIFDVVVPYQYPLTDAQVIERFRGPIRGWKGNYYAVITVDKSYVPGAIQKPQKKKKRQENQP